MGGYDTNILSSRNGGIFSRNIRLFWCIFSFILSQMKILLKIVLKTDVKTMFKPSAESSIFEFKFSSLKRIHKRVLINILIGRKTDS